MLEKARQVLNPPYKTSELFSIFIILFILITIPLTVFEINSKITPSSFSTLHSDSQSLEVSILTPANGETVKGTQEISFSAQSKNSAVKEVLILVNNRLVGTLVNQKGSLFSGTINWNTLKEKNEDKLVQAQALDTVGNQVLSEKIKVKVNNPDTTAPSVTFLNPEDGSYISGESFKIRLTASDENGVDRISLTIDGKSAGEITNEPYEINWLLKEVAPGNHVLKATAFDFAGNSQTASIQVYKGIKNLSLSN